MLTTCLSVALVAALAAKNETLSCYCQCRETRRRIHFPLFVRASAFKLSARCSSHTTSLLTCCNCDVMYGRKTSIVNKKISAKSGRNMLTIAAPSIMTTCTTAVEEFFVHGRDLPSSHPDQSLLHVHQMLLLRVLCCTTLPGLGMIFGVLCDHVPST